MKRTMKRRTITIESLEITTISHEGAADARDVPPRVDGGTIVAAELPQAMRPSRIERAKQLLRRRKK